MHQTCMAGLIWQWTPGQKWAGGPQLTRPFLPLFMHCEQYNVTWCRVCCVVIWTNWFRNMQHVSAVSWDEWRSLNWILTQRSSFQDRHSHIILCSVMHVLSFPNQIIIWQITTNQLSHREPRAFGVWGCGAVAYFAQFVIQSCGYVTTGFAFCSLSSSTSTKVTKNHKNSDRSDSGFYCHNKYLLSDEGQSQNIKRCVWTKH